MTASNATVENLEMKNKTKATEEKAHADFGASGSKRWMGCPGSIQMSEGMPTYESVAALGGTAAHACLEFLLKNRANLDKASTMALKTWTKEQVDHGRDAVKYVMKLLNKNTKLYIETRVDSSKFTTDGQFSTLDIAIANKELRQLTIADYKFGYSSVEVEDNPQLIYYALAMLLKLGWKNFDDVELTVIQPRYNHPSGETIRSVVMPVSEVLAWGKKFKKAVKAALVPNAPLKYDKDWCHFCPAKIKCPKVREESFKEAQMDFSVVKSEVGKVPNIKEIKDIGKMYAACEKLEVFIKAVKERAYNDLRNGKKVNGYKLVAQKSNRIWKDENKVSIVMAKKGMVEAFTDPKLKTPAQIEKTFKKNKKVLAWVDTQITKKPSGVTIAKESDKRKATTIVDADFSVLPGED